jgi:uncharacterized protein (TIGR02246 family)
MTDDVIFMVPGRPPFGKNEFAASSTALPAGALSGTAEVLEVHIHGDWAWAGNFLNLTFTPPGGQPLALSGYTLGIYRKNAQGNWQLTRDANLVGPHPKT